MNDIFSFWELFRIIRVKKPHIVHTHTAKAGTLGRLAAFVCGVPVKIHTFHGHIFHGYFNKTQSSFFLFIEKLLACVTDRIIFISRSQKEELVNKLKLCPQNKSVVIPLGFDVKPLLECEKLKGVFKKELGLPPDTMLVGIVGRLVPIKNHKMFFDSVFSILRNVKHRSLKFIVVGDGELRKDLEDYVLRLGISGSVIFTGWIKDIEKLYADLDILALTSGNEGTPVAIIEAMLAAKPAVATMVGGVCDIIEDGKNGFTVAPNDVKSFSDRISRLLGDEELRKVTGANGREFARELFSKERLVMDMEKLYEGCLKEKGATI